MADSTTTEGTRPADAASPAQASADAIANARLAVLVVEDSATVRKVAELTLAKADYQVTTADSTAAAWLALRAMTRAPALVLTDYMLPDKNGDHLCRALADDPAFTDVPVVVMSAHVEELGDRFAGLPNVADYLHKPFSPDALLAVVSHTLETRGRSGPGAPPGPGGFLAEWQRQSRPNTARPASPASAALSGDLSIIAISDVLTLLQDQLQTGVLTLVQGEGCLELVFHAGRVDFATAMGVPDEFLLGRFLVEAGQIPRAALTTAIDELSQQQKSGAARPLLGAYLIDRGVLTIDGLRKAMALQTSALVYESLRWGAGRFWFDLHEQLPPLAREASLGIGVDGLLMEGLRRVDEWRLIEREVGSFDNVFMRDDDRLTAFGLGRLLRDELQVLEHVNGKNSVRAIVSKAQLGSFDVSKMLYRLHRNKLIRRRVAPISV